MQSEKKEEEEKKQKELEHQVGIRTNRVRRGGFERREKEKYVGWTRIMKRDRQREGIIDGENRRKSTRRPANIDVENSACSGPRVIATRK